MHRHNISIRLALAVLALSLCLAGAGLAQEIPDAGCVVVDPGHPKKSDDDITFTILPVERNSTFPFPTTKEDVDYPCPGTYDNCIAAPYNITGGKFNEVWLSFPVDENEFQLIGVGPAGNPSGWVAYPPCSPDGLLNSCFHWQVKVSFQVTPDTDTQKFVLYFLAVGDSSVLGKGRSDFIGGSASNNLFCENGIEVPSTEVSCVDDPYEGKGRQEIEAFGSMLFRTWREPNGCASRVDVCHEGCFYPDKNECEDTVIDGYEWPSEIPGLAAPLCGWQPLTSETAGPEFGGLPIKDCGKTLSSVGNENPCLDECKLVVAENPGWIWYEIGGSWYKICGGYLSPDGQVCCDTVTKVCCFIDGSCCNYNTDPVECWGPQFPG